MAAKIYPIKLPVKPVTEMVVLVIMQFTFFSHMPHNCDNYRCNKQLFPANKQI